jgi:hypothetical protein
MRREITAHHLYRTCPSPLHQDMQDQDRTTGKKSVERGFGKKQTTHSWKVGRRSPPPAPHTPPPLLSTLSYPIFSPPLPSQTATLARLPLFLSFVTKVASTRTERVRGVPLQKKKDIQHSVCPGMPKLKERTDGHQHQRVARNVDHAVRVCSKWKGDGCKLLCQDLGLQLTGISGVSVVECSSARLFLFNYLPLYECLELGISCQMLVLRGGVRVATATFATTSKSGRNL